MSGGPDSFGTQHSGDGVWVGTRVGRDADTGKDISEFIIDERDGDHQHLGIDVATGETIFHNLNIRRD